MNPANTAISAIALCLIMSLIAGLIASLRSYSTAMVISGPLETYLLAGRSLKQAPVVSLLISTSFGINALFYQIWLGYSVGVWSLVIQAAWAFSFWLLAPHVAKIRASKSLHDLLALQFGPWTRVMAALCSLTGFIILMGWEVAICRDTLGGLLASKAGLNATQTTSAASWMSGIVVFGCLLYTVYGGLRGDSGADILQNFMKITGFALILFVLFYLYSSNGIDTYVSALFPSLEKLTSNIGLFALFTNVVFSVCWQFVDASTWQSLIASSKRDERETKNNLRYCGLIVFFAPGVLGTLIGVGLAGFPGIDSDNVLIRAMSITSGDSQFILFIIFFAITSCVMSLVDGLLLAAGYALVIDILRPNSSLTEIDANPIAARKLLALLRCVLITITLLAAWGIHALISTFDLALFSFVYLVTIPPLALIVARSRLVLR